MTATKTIETRIEDAIRRIEGDMVRLLYQSKSVDVRLVMISGSIHARVVK